ncbi:MAG: hypothetical protein IJ325_12190 [Clostridia bacterium]|nr:hypothetical protein [Clostridia bacterium]
MNSRFFDHPAFAESPFRFYGEDSILHERDLGIAGDRVTLLTPEKCACKVNGIQNAPWSGTRFSLELRIDGEQIPGRDWTWLPNAILRKGKRGNWSAETLTVIPPKKNGCIIRMAITNISDKVIDAPIQLIADGGTKYSKDWLFDIPSGIYHHFSRAETAEEDGISFLHLIGYSDDVETWVYSGEESVVAVSCTLAGMKLFKQADIWETQRTVDPGETLNIDITLHLGGVDGTIEAECADMCRKVDENIEAAFAWLQSETDRILDRLPQFTSNLPELDAMYYRSVVTYSLNRWENPHFVTNPFYSTGSINGGCMCSYLWDYGGGLMLHPLIDPETNKKMIRAYLHADLTKSFAIVPLDGSPYGPWYHINQEKIINMIYFHVLHTGETEFLSEEVDGRTILDWAAFHAFVGDDITAPQKLTDYGEPGKSHLELRRMYVYQGVMPDLNARRYHNYMRAYWLSCVAGKENVLLKERAGALKPLLTELWDEEAGWYDFIWDGKRQKRYTVQMFKFLDSQVIDDDTRAKLIAHLNEREFLSKFGLHSMSKLDAAYDQLDIDNGGGGICTLFTMQICGQLYDMGYDELATDILKRVLWWGTRLPYWGDSCAANMLEDREDTPLQADISSASCAQMMIFNMCGIKADFDGTIHITPAKVQPTSHIIMENVKLLGKTFSLAIDDNAYTVTCGGETIRKVLGETVVLA